MANAFMKQAELLLTAVSFVAKRKLVYKVLLPADTTEATCVPVSVLMISP